MPFITLFLLPLLQTAALEPHYAKLPNGIRSCIVPDRDLGVADRPVRRIAGSGVGGFCHPYE